MSKKDEIASVFDMSVGQIVDALKYFHVQGMIDDLNTLLITGDSVGVFRAPFACELVEGTIRVGLAETTDSNDEVLDLKKAASATALGSGTAMITQISLDPSDVEPVAHTDYPCAVNTDGTQKVVAGDMVGFVLGGTINEHKGIFYDLKFARQN